MNKAYQQVREVLAKYRIALDEAIANELLTLPDDNIYLYDPLNELRGRGEFTLTKEQARMLNKLLLRSQTKSRPQFTPSIYVSNGLGYLYVTDGTALVRIQVDVEKCSKPNFWGTIAGTFTMGMNPINGMQQIRPADFECVIPEDAAKLFVCNEKEMKTVAGAFAHLCYSVTFACNRLVSFHIPADAFKEVYKDLSLDIKGTLYESDCRKETAIGLSPEYLDILLQSKNQKLKIYQARPNSAVILRKEADDTIYLLMPTMYM